MSEQLRKGAVQTSWRLFSSPLHIARLGGALPPAPRSRARTMQRPSRRQFRVLTKGAPLTSLHWLRPCVWPAEDRAAPCPAARGTGDRETDLPITLKYRNVSSSRQKIESDSLQLHGTGIRQQTPSAFRLRTRVCCRSQNDLQLATHSRSCM